MIVPFVEFEEGVALSAGSDAGMLTGGCSGWMDPADDGKPRRPIGFRMPEPEPAPTDPSWMLL